MRAGGPLVKKKGIVDVSETSNDSPVWETSGQGGGEEPVLVMKLLSPLQSLFSIPCFAIVCQPRLCFVS